MPDTTNDILGDVRTTILETGVIWNSYLEGLSAAYSKAFDEMAGLLKGIRAALEARRTAENERILFVLSLSTAVFGGPVATYFAKWAGGQLHEAGAVARLLASRSDRDRMPSRELLDAGAAQAISIGQDLIKNGGKFSDGAQSKLDALEKAVLGIDNTPVPEQPFVPTGIDPKQYGPRLKQAQGELGNGLTQFARDLYAQRESISPAAASGLRKIIFRAPYFTGAPPLKMEEAERVNIERRIKLALWVAYALERDWTYWDQQRTFSKMAGFSSGEGFVWEPVRKELVALGVPEGEITIKGLSPREGYVTGLNMAGFIEWARKPSSLLVIFSGGPRPIKWNDPGMVWVTSRWAVDLVMRSVRGR